MDLVDSEKMDSPLSSLIVKEDEYFEQNLEKILTPLVAFIATGEVITKPEFSKLDATKKVLVIVLAFKALQMLAKRDSDLVGPTEIALASGLPSGTVRRTVRDLLKKRLLISTSRGKYSIPASNLSFVSEILLTGEKK